MSYDAENFPPLPHGWQKVAVADAAYPVTVRDKIPTKTYLKHGPLAVVDQGSELVGGYTHDQSRAVPTSLPVVVFGDHTRALKFIDFPFAAGADGIKIFRASHAYLPRLLFYFLRAIRLPDRGYARHYQFLRDSQIPLPPLPEQKRIADKLDILLARVDTCRSHLARVPVILKRFRQSVLAAATSGELTEEWRDTQKAELSWPESTFGATGTVTGGITKNSGRQNTTMTCAYLRVANVYANRLVLDDVQEIATNAGEFARTELQIGDLLIVEGNGSADQIGRAAMWRGEVPSCSHQNHLIRWRATGKVLPAFALYWLLSPAGRDSLSQSAKSSAGLYTLSLSKVSSVPLSVPPLAEQAEIVRRVESLFALADQLEARHSTARANIDRLTPALLSKAFRGELVQQDPNDESASEFLAKLNAEKSKSTSEPPRKPSMTPEKRPTMSTSDKDAVKAAILKLPVDRFSFEELRAQVSGDYESLKAALFELLEESSPVIRQVFNEEAKAMQLVRTTP